MSQDDRTSQPITDLSEKSAAGAIQDALGDTGTDAAMDDYDKSGAVDNMNTTSTGAVDGFDEEVQSAELQTKRSLFLQEGVDFLSHVQETVAKVSRNFQESVAEFVRVGEESGTKFPDICLVMAEKLSSEIEEEANAIQEATPGWLSAIHEAAAEYSSPFQVRAAQLLTVFKETAAEQKTDFLALVAEYEITFLEAVIAGEKSNYPESSEQWRTHFQKAERRFFIDYLKDASSAVQRNAGRDSTHCRNFPRELLDFLIAREEAAAKEASSAVHGAAAEASSVVQEAATVHAAEGRAEEDEGL